MAQQDTWTKKDLTGIEELSRSEIELLFRQADQFLPALAPGKGLDLMKGRTVVNLFLEPSTRTRTAFEISAKKLGAEVVSINTTASSLVKGETLRDTAENIRAMGVDAIVMRHSSAGSARYLGSVLDISVVNAGDGAHEHPTQALLDAFTLRRRFGKVEGVDIMPGLDEVCGHAAAHVAEADKCDLHENLPSRKREGPEEGLFPLG